MKAISSIGSGDSLIAGVTFALEQGLGIEEALRLGCAAGAAIDRIVLAFEIWLKDTAIGP